MKMNNESKDKNFIDIRDVDFIVALKLNKKWSLWIGQSGAFLICAKPTNKDEFLILDSSGQYTINPQNWAKKVDDSEITTVAHMASQLNRPVPDIIIDADAKLLINIFSEWPFEDYLPKDWRFEVRDASEELPPKWSHLFQKSQENLKDNSDDHQDGYLTPILSLLRKKISRFYKKR